jgi:hypothetical protein
MAELCTREAVMATGMHDYKYGKAVLGKRRWEDCIMDLVKTRTEALRPVVDAFVKNVNRSNCSVLAPSQIAWKVRRDQVISDCAMMAATGKLEPLFDKFDEAFEPGHKYREEFENLTKKFFSNLTPENHSRLIYKYGVGYIDVLLAETSAMRSAIEALFGSLIIEAWITFETLAADLWVVAVDTGPKDIRLRVANSNKLLKPDDNIGAKELFDAEFDPSSNYGSSLRELGRISFQKLDHIKRFYSIAFTSDFDAIFNEVEDGYILALSAFRNALIHNSGKADKKFVKQVQGFEEFREIQAGEKLWLDGERVAKLQWAARALSVRLVKFVDDLISPRAVGEADTTAL